MLMNLALSVCYVMIRKSVYLFIYLFGFLSFGILECVVNFVPLILGG